MLEDLQTNLLSEFFTGGWRIAPFIRTTEGYIGVRAWPKRAATDMAQLQQLVAELSVKSNKTPVFGIVAPKGRYIVDIDTKKNSSALQLWKDRVHQAYGDIAIAEPSMVVKTKSGGFHLYYSDGSDRQLHSPTSIFSKDSGIDIRGFTGMVIAPSSMGTVEDWQLGEYVLIKGRPTDQLTVLGLSKIIGDTYDEADTFIRNLLHQVNAALRNDSVPEHLRHRLLSDDLIIPASNRDNTLYRCARLCRLAGLSQDSALTFMGHMSARCETSPEEPAEHWAKLASDKVLRVYANESEMTLKTISGFYDELDNAGTVLLRGVAKSYYYFRYGSKLLRIQARDKFSTDNFPNVLQGTVIKSDDGDVPVRKVLPAYSPKDVAYSAAMYPKANLPYFEFENQRYVNTYHDPFCTFEPRSDLLERALPYVQKFAELAKHITGYEDHDDDHLLDKLAWIVQRPYRRLPTATIIYSHTRGSGKDVFMSLIREIVGRPYYMPITLQSIESEHTLLHDKIVCVASEIQLQANSRGSSAAASFMGRIKDLITTKTVYVNEKFVQPYSAPIFTNFFMLSNFELSSILEPGDRRMDIFHAAEEKLPQDRFGDLADVGNDGIWMERTLEDQLFRKHIIYALRRALADRQVDGLFDRQEARLNPVKQVLLESQNPPALEWLRENLPTYFTDDIVMMACFFCPMKIMPEYVMKQIREHFGPAFKPLYRSGRVSHRINGGPKISRRADSTGSQIPMLDFEVKSMENRKAVYYFSTSVRDAHPSDYELKAQMHRWYSNMLSKYYGNITTLPALKPDVVDSQ